MSCIFWGSWELKQEHPQSDIEITTFGIKTERGPALLLSIEELAD